MERSTVEIETLDRDRIVERIGEGGMGVVYKALEQGRWVFAGHTPDSFKGYTEDHVQLLVRSMFQFTANEQRRLIPLLPVTAGTGSRKACRSTRAAGPS